MSDSPTRDPFKYTPKTDAELEKLAWDIIGGQVFGTWSHPEAAKHCFMVLMFLDRDQLQAMRDARIAHIYEYLDKAGERSVNGMPMFMSMQMIDDSDTEKLTRRIGELEKLKQERAAAATGSKT